MDPRFKSFITSLEPSYKKLIRSPRFKFDALPEPASLPKAGVYLFSQGDQPLYVGRSDSIRSRLQAHCRPGSTDSQAAFAFLLAREKSGRSEATYMPVGSRKDLMADPIFRAIFTQQKELLRKMDIRVVEEADPHRQALLEMYVAICLNTPYNHFKNH